MSGLVWVIQALEIPIRVHAFSLSNSALFLYLLLYVGSQIDIHGSSLMLGWCSSKIMGATVLLYPDMSSRWTCWKCRQFKSKPKFGSRLYFDMVYLNLIQCTFKNACVFAGDSFFVEHSKKLEKKMSEIVSTLVNFLDNSMIELRKREKLRKTWKHNPGLVF